MAARLMADTSDFNRGFSQAGDKVEQFDKRVEQSSATLKKHATVLDSVEKAALRVGVAVGKIALTSLVAGFAAATGAIAAATKESIDFESSFTGVRKTVDASEAEFAALSAQIRQMSKDIPVNVNELNKIGEAAGQLGIKKEAIADFIHTMADIGVSTNLSADRAADALARLANITQMPQDQFRNLGSTVVALGNHLAATETDIVEMGLRLAGAGHTIGLTEAQILALAGALSSVGIDAEAGGTAFSKVMVDMADAVAGSTKEARQRLADMAQVMGITTDQFKKRFKEDAAGALVDFVESLGKLQKAGGDIFGTLETLGMSEIRQRDALLRAAGAGDLFRESLEIGSRAWEENNALTAEAAKRYETTESKIGIAENTIRDMAITVGGPFKDAFGELVGAMADALKGEDDQVAKLTGEFAPAIKGAADELKPLITGFLKDGPNAIETFGAAVLTLKGYLDTLGRVLDTVGGKLGMMAEPAAGLKNAIGDALFGDFAQDVERKRAELNGIPYETPHQRSDRQDELFRATGMTEHQIRDMSQQGLGPGLPGHTYNAQPKASDYMQSGGVWVLKEDAEARLKAAQEAEATYREALAAEGQAAALGATPQPAPYTGSAPETKEDRLAREKAAKDAAAKAKAAADKAAREAAAAVKRAEAEAQRAAERHAEMISQFQQTIEEGGYAVENSLTKFAARANTALGNVFEADASGAAGASLARSIGDLIKQAEGAGVENAKELGDALIAAASRAVIDRTPEAKEAVRALIEQMNAAILERSELTVENFGKAFDREALSFQLGSTGAAIMDALGKSIEQGGVKNMDALAKATGGMRRLLIEDLNPEVAAELGGTMMELLAKAIEEKSPEAIQALEDFLRQMNQLLPLEKAGEAMADRINHAIDAAATRIHEIEDSATKRITEAENALVDSREIRAARENVSKQQEQALKEATDAIEKERQAYKDMRDEQHTLDARKLEDAETAHRRDLEDTKALKDFNDSLKENRLHDTVGMSTQATQELQRRGQAGGFDTGQRADPALEARKAFEKKQKETAAARVIEDAETERRRGIEDQQRKDRLAERDEDEKVERQRQENMTIFKKEQAKQVQNFEDTQADEALTRQNTRTTEAAQLEIDKANAALGLLEADENAKFANLQSKIESLASVGIAAVQKAGDSALDGMVTDSGTVRDNLAEAEATQRRMSGAGGPVAGAGTQHKPPVPSGGIDPYLPPKEPLDPGNGDPGDGDPSGDPEGDPSTYWNDPVPLAKGGIARRPTLAMIAERHRPEAVAPLSALQSMVNSAAAAGIARYEEHSPANTGPNVLIEMPNASFYGPGGAKGFTRQVNSDLTRTARDKQAVQGD